MLKIGMCYNRDEWKKETGDRFFGIEKDVVKDKYAPQVEYADFFLGESLDGNYVYGAVAISDDSFWGGLTGAKKIKVYTRRRCKATG